jgi:hypothetical protein
MPAKTSVQQLRDLFAGPDVVSHASRHRRGPGVRIPEALGGRDTLRAPRSTPRPGRYSVSTPAPVPAARSRAAGAASVAGAEIWPNADVLIAHRAGRTLLRPDELGCTASWSRRPWPATSARSTIRSMRSSRSAWRAGGDDSAPRSSGRRSVAERIRTRRGRACEREVRLRRGGSPYSSTSRASVERWKTSVDASLYARAWTSHNLGSGNGTTSANSYDQRTPAECDRPEG